MRPFQGTRRNFLLTAPAIAGAAALGGASPAAAALFGKGDKDVSANEDLMREHGVLRRALLIYRAGATRLRRDASRVDPAALRRTAALFKTFGHDYHEKKLEEALLFPELRKSHNAAGSYVDVLIAQHDRGRQITDYILTVTGKRAIGGGDTDPLARAFDTVAAMYDAHTAREDTVIFPAWKDGLSDRQYREMGDRFEEVEKQTFGKDGFEWGVAEIGDIEKTLGLFDLALVTAPEPPRISVATPP
jgi:hemerythrin-like domain-containing protein